MYKTDDSFLTIYVLFSCVISSQFFVRNNIDYFIIHYYSLFQIFKLFFTRGRTQDALLLLMEKGDVDLSKTLKKFDKTIPIEKVKEYWEQILKAVKVVHDRDIVHADLKPANFLFVGNSLKLIDFGISNDIQVKLEPFAEIIISLSFWTYKPFLVKSRKNFFLNLD